MSVNISQITNMVRLQDSMNSKVDSDWREKNREWYRAIWVESAEMLDHHGWKWWKHQPCDLDQVKLELVDIWHFGLSILIQQTVSHNEAAQIVEASLDVPIANPATFGEDLEEFVCITIASRNFDLIKFRQLMHHVDLSMDELYHRYVGKNVLNMFRQDHGYKEGDYLKEWNGREDNVHLIEVMDELDATLPSFPEDLYAALEDRYQA